MLHSVHARLVQKRLEIDTTKEFAAHSNWSQSQTVVNTPAMLCRGIRHKYSPGIYIEKEVGRREA